MSEFKKALKHFKTQLSNTLVFSVANEIHELVQQQEKTNGAIEKLVAILSDIAYGTGDSRVDSTCVDTYGLLDATDAYCDDWCSKVSKEEEDNADDGQIQNTPDTGEHIDSEELDAGQVRETAD